METLIKITRNPDGTKVVSARELHSFLSDSAQNVTDWMAENIKNNEYAEQDVDYQRITVKGGNGRAMADYALSLDFAKELAMMSRCERGKQARRYFIEVEKLARAASSPLTDVLPVDEHIKRPVQLESSKLINGHLVNGWGATTAIEYNRQNCKIVTGFYPSELIEIAKKRGLKSKQYASGKEVVRNLKPAWAAQMSINDRLVKSGIKLNDANALSAPCLPLLEKMIELKLLTA